MVMSGGLSDVDRSAALHSLCGHTITLQPHHTAMLAISISDGIGLKLNYVNVGDNVIIPI